MRAGYVILLAPVLLLAACQTTYQAERERTYTEDKQVIWDNLLAFLERNEIAVTSSNFDNGSVVAQRQHFQDEGGWADCERRRVTYDRRMSWALRMDRSLALDATVAEAAGATRVTVDARFTEQQDDPNSFETFTEPCRSRGVLEKALLDSLGTPAATSSPQDTPTQ